MKNSKSLPLNYSTKNSNVSYSLVIREAISKLALAPAETIKYLNNEHSIWSNNPDSAIQYALAVLKRFYLQLKTEISTKTSVEPESLFKFLAQNNEKKVGDVITRICGKDAIPVKRKKWRHLKIADPDSARDMYPVPSNVPPLDVSGWSADEEGVADGIEFEDDTSESSIVYCEPAKKGEYFKPVVKSSSSSSSSTISSSLNPNEKRLKETQKVAKNVLKIVHKVDKAISPRSQPPSSRHSEKTSISLTGEKSENLSSHQIPQSSKAIQTDFEISVKPKTFDVAVSARLSSHRTPDPKSHSSVTTSLHRLIDKSSGETSATTNATSSSMFSSSLSAGEIPLEKVAHLTARSKYTVVSIRPDGSCSSAVANYQAFKETAKFFPSSSKTPTLIESRDELTSYHNSSFANLPPLKTSTPKFGKTTTTFGVNTRFRSNKESDGEGHHSLRVMEHSLLTTHDGNTKKSPQVEELTPKEIREHLIRRHLDAEAISMRASEEEEEESTLNQVSPLNSE